VCSWRSGGKVCLAIINKKQADGPLFPEARGVLAGGVCCQWDDRKFA
jgi:hypothetical protein